MTGASFVVVANRRGIRYSHPNPRMIGKTLLYDPGENPAPVLAGKEVVVTEAGSLGQSVRAKVPIYSLNGQNVIGLVSVGVLQRTLAEKLRSDLPVILIPPLLGLALGAVGSILLARRIKRQTFGLEPDEIATALEQREAMLHGIRGGRYHAERGTDSLTPIASLDTRLQRWTEVSGRTHSGLSRRCDRLVIPWSTSSKSFDRKP